MIVNAFSVIAAFAAILRVALGLMVLFLGILAIRHWRRARESEAHEQRFYLLVGSCVTLALLAAVSWPLLYLVLQSYASPPRWPGVMCIAGVTRVGTGSVGAASRLPGLLAVLAVTKPLLAFVSGAWLVLHLVNRRERTGALTHRVLALLVLCGSLGVADGAVETAYLFIPKQEKFLAAGCCGADMGAEASVRASLLPAEPRGPTGALSAAFLALGSGLVVALTAAIRRGGGPWLWVSLAGAILSLPLGLVFLRDVAAPGFLHTPYHACIYCLARWMPETLLGAGLYVLGAFGVGWAVVARSLGKGGGAGEGISLRLLRIARFGYLGSLLMAAVMMVSS